MSRDPAPAAAHSVFADTMADMTYPEVEAAAGRGAIVLWALGVIEQHGPHLPLATDVYVPMAVLRQARRILAARGTEAVIAPPFFWGVNDVSRSFPGTFKVRPAVMVELMRDVFASLAGDGFRRVFCLSGHGDALHNRTIHEAIAAGCDARTLEGFFVLPGAMRERLGLDPADERLVPYQPRPTGTPEGLDIHAGEGETSVLLAECCDLCRRGLIRGLAPTRLKADDLAVWRKGGLHARAVTPLGYFGDPASATAGLGQDIVARNAAGVADAIGRVLGA